MKSTTIVPKFLRKASIAAGALAVAISTHAGLQIPYTPNADTLHLWHLNDPANQLYAHDSGVIPMTLTNLGIFGPTNVSPFGPADGTVVPLPLTGYTNCNFGCNLGLPVLNTLLGTCFISSNLSLVSPGSCSASLLGNIEDTGLTNYCNATTGAFTWEMLIKLNLSYGAGAPDIYFINGDNGATERGWQWRLDTGSQPQMELNGINVSGSDFKPNIPVSGPDAIATNAWYHIAITFTGTSPTNADTPNVTTMYWTLLDPARTNVDAIGSFTNTGGILGSGTPTFCIGQDARYVDAGPLPQSLVGKAALTPANCPATGDALDFANNIIPAPGGMAEARITDLCLGPSQMVMGPGGGPFTPVVISPLNPKSVLVGYGQPLSIPALVSANPTASYQWYQGGTAPVDSLPGQTNIALSIADVTFANGGAYYMIASNTLGAATTAVTQVTIGAVASELFSTGVDTNGQLIGSPANIPDPHYTLIQSDDPGYLGPDAMVFDTNACPICAGGAYTSLDGISIWIGPTGNSGGGAPADPKGLYTYRTEFVLDQVDPNTATLSINTGASDGEIVSAFVNGIAVGPVPAAAVPGYTLYSWLQTTITNKGIFVQGINTLDLVLNSGLGQVNGGEASFRMEPFLVGQANANGTPVILQQPVSLTIRDAGQTSTTSQATFSVVATSRPPLTYQWWADGSPIANATNRTLTYFNPTVGAQGTNFYVEVTGPSGSVSSSNAMLTLVDTNALPVAPNYTFYVYTNASQSLTLNQNLTIDISMLLANAGDPIAGIPVPGKAGDAMPDGDALTLSVDGSSTNGVPLSSPTFDTLYVYNPSSAAVPGAPDEFNYYISDAFGETAIGQVRILIASGGPPAAAVQTGNTIAISGSGGTPSGAFTLLYTTNLLAPLSAWKTNASGTFDVYGNYSVNLPINSKTNTIYTVLRWGGASAAIQVPPFAVEK
ncbi:MAG TPA: immunoglobulin domain-containing protein [Verrucomicrobiae bacterium]|nr:immunoglobulin domain-containing protein [Verrucomicrobiae bacterium]